MTTDHSAPICLIAEDEYLIALHMEMELSGLGLAISGPYATETAALAALEQSRPAVAVLDCQLQDGMCIRLARRLNELAVPYVIHSAHRSGDRTDPAFGPAAWVAKPSVRGELEHAVAALLGG